MSIEPTMVQDRESLAEIESALDGMMVRVQAIVAEGRMTQDTLVEITSIYNNVAYIFLYLEANDDQASFDRLLPWRDVFYQNPELDRQVLVLLTNLRCTDPEAEESRRAYVEQLREKAVAPDPIHDERMATLLADAKSVLDTVRNSQVRMLERIGAGATVNPSAMFYKLIGGTASPERRTKLARAWTAQRDRENERLITIIDSMIEVRRACCAATGHLTPLARTLQKCRVAEADVEAFLDRYLRQALESHAVLEAEVLSVTGTATGAMDHFAFAMSTSFGGGRTPLFDLDECMAYIFAVTRSVFGLVARRREQTNPDIITVGIWAGDLEIGQINFDLWGAQRKSVGANHTKGIRNRTDWSGLVQHPVAYVCCRFQRDRDGADRINFQNVHSLFHEFGHALNHLLIRKRISNRSGLEYLPLERLEYLSMWFEKWVYHPAFAEYLSLPTDDREALSACTRIKMIEYRRTYVERAVTAILDFDVHRLADGGLADAFNRLDDRYGVSRFCSLGDYPTYFTWPMYVANPGANFSYLWGAADSCQKFAPFETLGLDEVRKRSALRELFASCFDFDLPSDIPDSSAVFAFYDSAAFAGTADRP